MSPTMPPTLSALVALVASARHGSAARARDAFSQIAPDAADRRAIVDAVRLLDPEAADVLERLLDQPK